MKEQLFNIQILDSPSHQNYDNYYQSNQVPPSNNRDGYSKQVQLKFNNLYNTLQQSKSQYSLEELQKSRKKELAYESMMAIVKKYKPKYLEMEKQFKATDFRKERMLLNQQILQEQMIKQQQEFENNKKKEIIRIQQQTRRPQPINQKYLHDNLEQEVYQKEQKRKQQEEKSTEGMFSSRRARMSLKVGCEDSDVSLRKQIKIKILRQQQQEQDKQGILQYSPSRNSPRYWKKNPDLANKFSPYSTASSIFQSDKLDNSKNNYFLSQQFYFTPRPMTQNDQVASQMKPQTAFQENLSVEIPTQNLSHCGGFPDEDALSQSLFRNEYLKQQRQYMRIYNERKLQQERERQEQEFQSEQNRIALSYSQRKSKAGSTTNNKFQIKKIANKQGQKNSNNSNHHHSQSQMVYTTNQNKL